MNRLVDKRNVHNVSKEGGRQRPAEFCAFWDFRTERSRSHSMEGEKKRKENPRKSAVNEKSFYWWFWKNIDYIKTAGAERAGRRGRRRCSKGAVLVQVQSLFINQVWDHVQPGERTSTAGRRQEKGAGGEVCIVLTEEKDGGKEDPRWEIPEPQRQTPESGRPGRR